MARSDRDWFWRSPIMDLILAAHHFLLLVLLSLGAYLAAIAPRRLPYILSERYDVLFISVAGPGGVVLSILVFLAAWRTLIRLEGRAGIGRLLPLFAALSVPVFGLWMYRRRLRPRLLAGRGFDVISLQ